MAIFLSSLCLLHCLAIPFALLLGPVLSPWLTSTETQVHWGLLALAAPISVFALGNGFRRHRSHLTLWLGLVGLGFMLLAVTHLLGEQWEIALTVVGVIMVLIAHIRNTLAGHDHNSHTVRQH